jgi:hypothetical protein
MELTMLNSGIWFLIGAICYMFLDKLINTAKAVYILQESIDSGLRVLDGADSAMGEAIKFKKDIVNKEKKPEAKEDIEKLEETREVWRALSIIRMINSVPEKYRIILKFNNWAQAMKLIR